MKKRTLPRGMIGDLYENDAWVRGFMDECFLMWGYPCSSKQCMTQTDRSMFAWGMLHLVQSLTIDKEVWWGMREKVCLLYTSPSPRDKRQSRMPSSA